MSDLTTTTNQQFDLSPQNFDQALTFSKYLAGSDMVPKDFKGKPENCLIAMQWGYELARDEFGDGGGVVSQHADVAGHFAEDLHDVIGEGVVVVDHEDHGGGSPGGFSGRGRRLPGPA